MIFSLQIMSLTIIFSYKIQTEFNPQKNWHFELLFKSCECLLHKISKKGNAKLRTALYLPAMSASRYNIGLKKFYDRINDGKKVKKQGVIAVMRKLLILIYTLWKKEEEYIEDYNVT